MRAHSLVGERPIGSDARGRQGRSGTLGSAQVRRRSRGSACPSTSAAPSAEKTATPHGPEQKIPRAYRLSAACSELRGRDALIATAAEANFAPGTPCASFAEVRGQSTHAPRAVGEAGPQAAADPHERMRGHPRRRGRCRHTRNHGGDRVRVGRQLLDDRHRLPASDPGVRAEQRHSGARARAARPHRALAQRAPAVQPQERVRSPASSSRPRALTAAFFSARSPLPASVSAAAVVDRSPAASV